jgi:hypothetical protein
MKKQTYFISGHLTLSEDEFNEHYKTKIDNALAESASFVLGDARGTDEMAQIYLKDKTDNVIVYHMFDSPRNNQNFPLQGGFDSDKSRDTQMTADSDCDIAWVRPGREKSGTANNLKRRI